jgi:hypothetical protein
LAATEIAMMKSITQPLLAGIAGASVVTAVHETVRRVSPRAPRMDVVGERGLQKVLELFGARAPRKRHLYWPSLAAEIAANSGWYALVGVGRGGQPMRRGIMLGALAGLGGVFLTPLLGLGVAPVKRTPATAAMTFSWYLLGGVVAGAVAAYLNREDARAA